MYIDFMLFFPGKPKPEQDDIVKEKWTADFSVLYRKFRSPLFGNSPGTAARRSRLLHFSGETGDGYQSAFSSRGLELILERENLFAWNRNPLYRYDDFILQADCSFDGDNGYSSLGFCFRQMNENNYYYFLVSNRGYFRFDLVFNGSPQILIPWTPFQRGDDGDTDKNSIHLRIIAHGERFIFFIREDWAGEVDDDTIPSGSLAWAGQNYGEKPRAGFFLKKLILESRPVEVESSYYRWGQYLPVEPEARYTLAENLYATGAFSTALIQLKKISRARALNSRELLLLTQSFLGAGLYEEALGSSRRYRMEDPNNPEILRAAGVCLYQLNRFKELRELLKEREELLSRENWYWGLLGNCEYTLGNWEPAAGAYEKAAAADPGEPLIQENLARARTKLGSCTAEVFLEAALLYFRREDLGEAASLLARVRELDPDNPGAAALEGKICFQKEEWEKAEELFEDLIEREAADSSVFFLYGLLLSRRGERRAGMEYLEKAATLEPEEPVYQFKAAEARYLSGDSPQPFLARALSLDLEDPWAYNLAGLDALARGNPRQAAVYLSRAREKDRDNREILINYSQALFDAGDSSRALEVLEAAEGPEAANQKGNLLSLLGDYPRAVDAYERAMALDRDNRSYRLNCASACIEADFIHRAEELLQTVSGGEEPEVYNLLGNLARLKGEFSRAESAYLAALKAEPENASFLVNIAELQHQRGNHRDALVFLERIPPELHSRRSRRLEEVVRDALELHIRCAACSREWVVPRDIPPQSPLKIRGEVPEEAPGGKCPACGKIFCVGCAGSSMEENRFVCRDCGDRLDLNDDFLRYILRTKLNLKNG